MYSISQSMSTKSATTFLRRFSFGVAISCRLAIIPVETLERAAPKTKTTFPLGKHQQTEVYDDKEHDPHDAVCNHLDRSLVRFFRFGPCSGLRRPSRLGAESPDGSTDDEPSSGTAEHDAAETNEFAFASLDAAAPAVEVPAAATPRFETVAEPSSADDPFAKTRSDADRLQRPSPPFAAAGRGRRTGSEEADALGKDRECLSIKIEYRSHGSWSFIAPRAVCVSWRYSGKAKFTHDDNVDTDTCGRYRIWIGIIESSWSGILPSLHSSQNIVQSVCRFM